MCYLNVSVSARKRVGHIHHRNSEGDEKHFPSDPNPKFAYPRGWLGASFEFKRVTSNTMSIVWFTDLKFVRDFAA